jgi:hypothetical protein
MTALPSLYSRQFVAGPRSVTVPNLSRGERFGHLHLHCHADLNVTRASDGDRELLCLGHILNPRAPAERDADIICAVVARTRNFDALEKELAHFGGRWLIFARFGDAMRLYPDAVATKSSFYINTREGLWIASQPRALVDAIGVEVDDQLWDQFLSAPAGHSWPAAVTPYKGVSQLLPNHYLDLHSGAARRYWPRENLPSHTVDEAAASMAEMLHGTMAALLERGTVGMAVTAGYDTRTLFACAGSLREKLYYFVVNDPAVAWHDIYLPRKLAQRFGCTLDVVPSPPVDDAFWTTLQRNVGGLWWDPGDRRLKGFESVPTRFIMLSLMSEVTRCHYYQNGIHPQTLSPEFLASISGYRGNPVAIASFSAWLEDMPTNTNVNGLDLFFSENRLGNYASMLFTAADTLTEIINPYNCRELLDIGLGVALEDRCAPYNLHRKICVLTAPETLRIPINKMWQEDFLSSLSSLIPWRLRTATFGLVMRLSGNEWRRNWPQGVSKWVGRA